MQEKWCLRSKSRSAGRPESVLRNLRIAQGLSQYELAELTGMSTMDISRLESGKRGVALKKVLKLAEFLGIGCNTLLLNDFEVLNSGCDYSPRLNMNTVGDSAVTGVKYWRFKRHITRKSLAKQSGIVEMTLKDMEEDFFFSRPSCFYMRIAAALNVTVDDLAQSYPVSMLAAGDRYVRKSTSANPNNCLAVYKMVHHLNNEQMANLLGLAGRESARKVCERDVPQEKYVKRLAQYEGISEEEFIFRYGVR